MLGNRYERGWTFSSSSSRLVFSSHGHVSVFYYLGSDSELGSLHQTLIQSLYQPAVLFSIAFMIGHTTVVPAILHAGYWLAGYLGDRLLALPAHIAACRCTAHNTLTWYISAACERMLFSVAFLLILAVRPLVDPASKQSFLSLFFIPATSKNLFK